MARGAALAAALAVSLLFVSGAGGAATQQTPKRGGTVVVGPFYSEPACLNVVVARCNPAFGPAQLAIVFLAEKVLQPAFGVGRDFTYEPRLVASFEFTRKRPFVLTYRIRRDARWSDGTPVTAGDFVFTHNARVALRNELQTFEREDLDHVRSVSVVDAKTVRIVLRSRFAAWRRLFGNILPRHALRRVDLRTIWSDGIVDPRTGRPIGSGPFLVEGWERGRGLTLRRNPRYVGPRPARLDRVSIRFRVEGTDPRDWFRRERVDVAFMGGVPAAIPELQREPGLRVLRPLGYIWEHFAIRIGSGGHPALELKPVRRALAYGIDRAGLLRAVGEAGHPVLDSVVFPAQSRSYRPVWQRYRHRPVLARRLLDQAGCRVGGSDGVRMCGGQRLSLRFVTTAGVSQRERMLSVVQQQLRRIGVEVVPRYGTLAAVFGPDGILQQGEFDVALFAWVLLPDASGKPIFGCGGAQNYTGYCQRLVTRDLDQAERVLDGDQRARALARADAQLARDVPVLPLLQPPLLYALRSTLRGVDLSGVNPLMNAEDWWLDR